MDASDRPLSGGGRGERGVCEGGVGGRREGWGVYPIICPLPNYATIDAFTTDGNAASAESEPYSGAAGLSKAPEAGD